MKSFIKTAGGVILFGLLIFLGARLLFTQEVKQIKPGSTLQPQDTTLQETYVSKVVLSAPWGKKNLVYDKEESPPGEFGYYVSEETEGGPGCFAVAPNGDIYILDGLNRRIQRFSPGGSFISSIPLLGRGGVDLCIDQNNNIYLLRPGWKPEELGNRPGTVGAVLKCDQRGTILKTYPVYTGVATTADFVFCDRFGRIFLAYPWNGEKSGFYQVGTSERAFSLTEQKNSTRIGWLGFNSVALDKNLFFCPRPVLHKFQHGPFLILSLTGDTLKISRYPIWGGWLFGFDEKDNIYMYYWDNEALLGSIRKYDSEGTFLSTFEYQCQKPFLIAEGFGGSRTVTLDEKGNLYVLCYSEEDGIEVIKWYKQK